MGVEAGAPAGRDAVGPLVQTLEEDPLKFEVDGTIDERAVDSVVGDAFPGAPTVVQAPPVWVAGAI